MLEAGLDPAMRSNETWMPRDELEQARADSGLIPVVEELRAHLLPAVLDAGQIMVITDASGRVLWRDGSRGAIARADSLGFLPGSHWNERTVGTNAIGTALIDDRPLHVHAEEHFAEDHTRWTCAAAPLSDPAGGRPLGIVDVSGPVSSAHPHTLPMVVLAARAARLELAVRHEAALAPLRAHAAGVLSSIDGSAVVVSQAGHVAAARGTPAPSKVRIPREISAGVHHVPELGWVDARPLAGGWLLRTASGEASSQRNVDVHVDPSSGVLRVSSGDSSWSHRLSPRHTDLVLALCEHRPGWTAAALAEKIFGDRTRDVTVRAEMSRLRHTLGPLLSARPYRWSPHVTVRP